MLLDMRPYHVNLLIFVVNIRFRCPKPPRPDLEPVLLHRRRGGDQRAAAGRRRQHRVVAGGVDGGQPRPGAQPQLDQFGLAVVVRHLRRRLGRLSADFVWRPLCVCFVCLID